MSGNKEKAASIDSGELSRRNFIFNTLGTGLSAAAIALLSGYSSLGRAAGAEKPGDTANDVRILGTALSAEREAVAAYQLGADSGLLEPGVLQVAIKFQSHHKEHAEVLASTIRDLGGRVPAEAARYDFPADKLKRQRDVLTFAAGLERGAVSAYAGAIPLFDNRDLSRAAASILADEAMHWAVLRQALGLDPVPGAFFS
ncbi:MAG: ferritin-like domain-containing protein [Halioglobus sp.]|nr:ferritin-like domain-containing protein [Halioglobus sp.]